MKKFMLCALAILLACVFASPASAQSHRRSRSRGYYGDGYTGELNYDRHGRDRYNRGGYDYRYNRYDRYGGRGLSRNEAISAAAVIGGGLLINAVANRHRGDENRAEDPSKCFERVVKNARKQRLELDASEAMAFCSGQPLLRPEPEDQAVAQAPPTSSMSPVIPRAPRGVYSENGKLCNDDSRALTVLVDGRAVGIVAPGEYVTLSHMPAGQVSYRH